MIRGTANGISLSDGGSVANATASASIEGTSPIVASGAFATITNSGTIEVDEVQTSYTRAGASYAQHSETYSGSAIRLNAGGIVRNVASGRITSGIEIGNATGSVTNSGRIETATRTEIFVSHSGNASSSSTQKVRYASVSLAAGGTISNGSASDTSAVMTGGVVVDGGRGTVDNFGTIGTSMYIGDYGSASSGSQPPKSYSFLASVRFEAGGTLDNAGSGADLTYGISIKGGAGRVTNSGHIGGATSYRYEYSPGSGTSGWLETSATTTSVYLASGGSVTNAASGVMSGGIEISGAVGTVVNDGMVGSPSFSSVSGAGADPYSYAGISVELTAGGTVINGSAADATASLVGGTGVALDAGGRVVNFGTIEGTSGTAVLFEASASTLIEEGTGVLSGNVIGGGGTLELAGAGGAGTLTGLGSAITGFASFVVDAGATWTLSGTSTLASTTALTNKGALTNTGALAVSSQIVSCGSITNAQGATLTFIGDVSIDAAPISKAAAFSNAGTIAKTSGTGTSIIRTGSATLTDTGTIDVETGTLDLTGATVTVAGAIEGPGTIEFGPGSTMLNAGTTLSVGAVLLAGTGAHLTLAQSIDYGGAFATLGATELTIGAGLLVTLGGAASFNHGTIDGASRLTTKGATALTLVTLGGTVQWVNSGTVTETGALTIGDAAGDKASVVNQASGTFDLASSGGIAIGTATTSSFTNQGLLEKTAGAASTIAVGVVNIGTIAAASGTLDITGAVSGAGKATIANKAILEFDGSVSGGQAVSFGSGGGTLALGAAASFAGSVAAFGAGDTIDTEGFAATLFSYASNTHGTGGTLSLSNGSSTRSFALAGSYAVAGFHLASDKTGGTLVTYAAPNPMAAAQDGLSSSDGMHMSALAHALFDGAFAAGMITSVAAAPTLQGSAAIVLATAAEPWHN